MDADTCSEVQRSFLFDAQKIFFSYGIQRATSMTMWTINRIRMCALSKSPKNRPNSTSKSINLTLMRLPRITACRDSSSFVLFRRFFECTKFFFFLASYFLFFFTRVGSYYFLSCIVFFPVQRIMTSNIFYFIFLFFQQVCFKFSFFSTVTFSFL